VNETATSSAAQSVMRRLLMVWADFDSSLETVPLVDKLRRGRFRLGDYRTLLLNHRQQVIEGSRWIARAASSITNDFAELRSVFLKHAVTEHRDYAMLEADFVSIGGDRAQILAFEKNVGTEALHGFMFGRASEPNPFDLLGAMFVIEGVGSKKAAEWGRLIRDQLGLEDGQVSFLLYHGEHDADHLAQFEATLDSGILALPGMAERIVKTSAVVARLYRLQLEEMIVA
jgi:3-oxoacyl-[acyl-carrier-protein] synthase-3